VAVLVPVAAFVAAFALCALLIPVFRRAFLVTPGARSSHVKATPQGGGLVVIPVAIVAAYVALAGAGGVRPDAFAWGLIAALSVLTALGGWDDLAPLNPAFRLLVQGGAAALALAATPHDFDAKLPHVAPVIVWGCLLIGMLWFINLTNFMDGIDLMSVTQFLPAFATVYLLLHELTGPAQWVGALCLAAAGALAGFALLNKPQARLFLGDSGSLPLGLLGATALIVVAGARGPFVALLPFLYYIGDASLTLALRLFAGEKVWQAHRDHFYQRATRRGLSTWQVIGRVATCNILLCALALLVAGRSCGLQLAALAFGIASVCLLMVNLVGKNI
jgi:UDP-N-acetylmuramyl pentapeptide phosphotransferase/UDP-N-acetylglucosamine-1-phosphate transferase